jgi:DDRGK domain
MDERGKFIYISVEEMEAFAAHIRRAGRVSIAALAAASNDLIDLAPRTDDGDGPAGLAPPPGPALDFDTLAAGGLEPVAA